ASVNYTTSNGSATAGSDYTTAAGTIDFADGDAVAKTFNIPITDDSTWEGDETVNLSLTTPVGATLGTPSSAVLTITEDDPTPPAGSMQFDMAAYSVAENGTSATITVTRTGGDFGAASVNYTTSNGSATAGSDYTTAAGTIDFADGDAVAKTFNVPITDDSTWEGDETVNLSLGTAVGATLGTPSSAVLTITEDDPTPPTGSMQFDMAAYSVAENGTSVTITVTRTGGDFGAASVNYATSNGSATAGSDYTAATGTIDFADGDAVAKTFNIPITDDTTWEGDETVNLSLTTPGGATLGAPSSAVLTITEDDPTPPTGSVQLSAATYSVAENGTSATITVTRAGGDFGAASVNYTTSNGSATAGSDFTAAAGTIDFADGDAVAKTFNIPIIDDSTWEGDETVNLSLSTAVGASLGAPSSAVLTITEDDLTCGTANGIFCDDFESGNLDTWSASVP
ncbi:MAG: aggregation factor core protein MAFp3, isoform C, partial [Acidobacteriota bacterium]|nr:aggregation factor core protein MAFp3, isoform C [Acidobacteriota bacterium]